MQATEYVRIIRYYVHSHGGEEPPCNEGVNQCAVEESSLHVALLQPYRNTVMYVVRCCWKNRYAPHDCISVIVLLINAKCCFLLLSFM